MIVNYVHGDDGTLRVFSMDGEAVLDDIRSGEVAGHHDLDENNRADSVICLTRSVRRLRRYVLARAGAIFEADDSDAYVRRPVADRRPALSLGD
jgi:hypothetical protein